MISFISSLLIIISVVCFVKSKRCILDPNIFLWISASTVDAAIVYPNGIKTLLANGLSTFPIKGNPVFSNGPKSLPKDPPGCPVYGI